MSTSVWALKSEATVCLQVFSNSHQLPALTPGELFTSEPLCCSEASQAAVHTPYLLLLTLNLLSALCSEWIPWDHLPDRSLKSLDCIPCVKFTSSTIFHSDNSNYSLYIPTCSWFDSLNSNVWPLRDALHSSSFFKVLMTVFKSS